MAAVAPATESGRWFSEGSGGTTKPHSDFEHRTTEEMKADARLVVFFKNFTVVKNKMWNSYISMPSIFHITLRIFFIPNI